MRTQKSLPAARRSADVESDSCVTQDHMMDTSPAPALFQATDDEKDMMDTSVAPSSFQAMGEDKASRLQEGLFASFDGTRRDVGCGPVNEVAANRTLILIIIIGR